MVTPSKNDKYEEIIEGLHRIGILENKLNDFIVITFPKLGIQMEEYQKYNREFQVRILGNGDKGFVDLKIDTELSTFAEVITREINSAIGVAFAEKKKDEDIKTTERKTKWDARSWQVVFLIITTVLTLVSSVTMLYISSQLVKLP